MAICVGDECIEREVPSKRSGAGLDPVGSSRTAGDEHLKRRLTSDHGFARDGSADSGNNSFYRSQTKTMTVVFGGKIRIENTGHGRLVHAATVIDDA